MRLPACFLFLLIAASARGQGGSDFQQTQVNQGSGQGGSDFTQIHPQQASGGGDWSQSGAAANAAPQAAGGGMPGSTPGDVPVGYQGAGPQSGGMPHDRPLKSGPTGGQNGRNDVGGHGGIGGQGAMDGQGGGAEEGTRDSGGGSPRIDLGGAKMNFTTVVDSFFERRSAGKGYWVYAEKKGTKGASSRRLTKPAVSESSVKRKSGSRFSGLVNFTDARGGRRVRLEFVVDFSGADWRVVSVKPAAPVSSRR